MLPETKLCADCNEEIPQKRLEALNPRPRYCLTCQARRERRGEVDATVPDSVLAACGETDDSTRARESGWGEAKLPSRLHKTQPRLNSIFHLTA